KLLRAVPVSVGASGKEKLRAINLFPLLASDFWLMTPDFFSVDSPRRCLYSCDAGRNENEFQFVPDSE
ncbi:MAG TPA: hypothetical protein VLD57_12175, partial [Blastocatellia bacterium]|nr:hypothetical protein [Blastocatellia bacterium]